MVDSQIQRIKTKLAQLRKDGWSKYKHQLGVEHHQFETAAPASEDQLKAFENKHGIQLPKGYRAFLKEVGNGGAGPYYGLNSLEDWDRAFYFENGQAPLNFLSQPCRLKLAEWERRKDWKEHFGIDPEGDDSKIWPGTISLVSQGCTYYGLLVVTGELRDRVVYIDMDGQSPIICPDTSFLNWYERWLDETLAQLEIHWFGTDLEGTDQQLLEALKTGDSRTKCDALAGLARRKYPSSEITQALLEAANNPETLIRGRAMSALRNSGKAGLEIALKNLKDTDDEVVTFAGYLIGQIAGEGILNTVKNWVGLTDARIVPALREALINSKTDDRFFSLGCKLKDLGALKVEDFWPFITDPSPKIRRNAAWFLGEAQDPTARKYLLQTLNDSDAWVRHGVVQALHKYMNDEVRLAFKNRLQIETDSLVITNLKN